MKMNKTYNVGDAKYAAKKLLKSFKRNELDNPRLMHYLSTILIFAKDSCIPKLKKHTQGVINYLKTGQGLFEDYYEIVQRIEGQISKANEKRRVMEIRQNISCKYYRKRLAESDYSVCPSKLNVYDIIKVPTMGGMHYSIISEIHGEYIKCFPMTTANRKDLGLIGSKSISLSGCGDKRYEEIRISNSATRISHHDAIRSYVGTVADNQQICDRLSKIISLS